MQTAAISLRQAHHLMVDALALLDQTYVATDCDAHLDLAIHNLNSAIEQVEVGAKIFIDQPFHDRKTDETDQLSTPEG